MWRTWTNMQATEVEALKANAIHGTGILREGQPIPGAFPLALFDNQKCSSPEVRVLTKQALNSNFGRIEKYSSAIWNCQRPYLRCTCKPDASKGCKGDVMWFDQAVWFMVNNLHVFFDDEYPTLSAKFGAFIIWLSDAARVAVRHQITFHYIRNLMVGAALQFAADPIAKLLASHPPGAGIRQIERWIKPATFAAANPATPGSQNPSKRPRTSINCNAPASPGDDYRTPPLPRSAPRNTMRGGRGGYNRRFRPSPQSAPLPRQYQRSSPTMRGGHHQATPNEAFVFTGPAYRNHGSLRSSVQLSPVESFVTSSHTPTVSGSSPETTSPAQSRNETSSPAKTAALFERSSMRGRFLDWDSVGK